MAFIITLISCPIAVIKQSEVVALPFIIDFRVIHYPLSADINSKIYANLRLTAIIVKDTYDFNGLYR
jgi:uncharacterized Tic20 family protein